MPKTKKILKAKDVKEINPDLKKVWIISRKMAESIETIIFDWKNKDLKVLTTNQYSDLRKNILQRIENKGYNLDFYYTDDESIKHAYKRYDKLEQQKSQKQQKLQYEKTATWANAIKLIKKIYNNPSDYSEKKFITEIIRLSFQSGASDLHFQPEEDGMHLRLRKDWILKSLLTFSHKNFKKYMMKLKYMSWVQLNVGTVPQDGRFDFTTYQNNKPEKIDVRVNFMPWLRWESIVMRFLDSSQWVMSFSSLGFRGDSLEDLEENIQAHSGMILATWPTGSGKTSTLYSILNKLNSSDKKIITLEDPVEFEFPGIQQSQIDVKKWFTYAKGLKAVLRQDPDIIMVWEIRDLETAKIAVQAALTWHLVLSTLHTNSAPKAISRLINMGIEPYMLAPCLNLIIWQRLVRKLHNCKTYQQASLAEQQEIKQSIKTIKDVRPDLDLEFDKKVFHPWWCSECSQDGYKWRMAIVETLNITNDLQDIIAKNKWSLDIFSYVRQSGYLTMKEDGYIKMLRGKTSLEEIRRLL